MKVSGVDGVDEAVALGERGADGNDLGEVEVHSPLLGGEGGAPGHRGQDTKKGGGSIADVDGKRLHLWLFVVVIAPLAGA